MIYKYNDNELLYLVYEGEDYALGILFNKYFSLIYKRLRAFKIKQKNAEDFFQEGLMALNDAINTFNPMYSKSFNKYFDLILQRRFINILRKESNYFYKVTLVDDFYGALGEDLFTYNQEIIENNLNKFENEVFELRFKRNYKARDIANILKCDLKKVYNTIYLVKQKITKDNQ